MPDAWVANPWHVSLSPTTRPLLVELGCSARGVLLPAWSSLVCGGMSCPRRAQVGSTPQDYPQESLWSGGMPSYMVVQQPLTTINWLDSTSRMYWMVRRSRNHSECRAHGQNPRSGPGQYCEVEPLIPSTPVLLKRPCPSLSQIVPTMPAWLRGRVSHWQNGRRICGEFVYCNLADIMRSPKKRGARDLSSHQSRAVPWGRYSNGLVDRDSFRAPTVIRGPSICVLCCSSFPTPGQAREPAISVRATESKCCLGIDQPVYRRPIHTPMLRNSKSAPPQIFGPIVPVSIQRV